MSDLIKAPTPDDFALADDPRDTAALSDGERAGRLDQNWQDYARTANPRTLATYQAGVARFVGWCDLAGHPYTFPSDPVSPRTLAAWIDAIVGAWAAPLSEESRSLRVAVSTVKTYLAGIAKMHTLAGWPSPVTTLPVQTALKRFTTAKGGAQKQAAPLRWDVLSRILADLDKDGSPAAIRDAALLSLAYDTMCRRSEIAALDVQDIESGPDGATVYIARSKSDQKGEGQYRALPPRTFERVQRLIDHAGLTDGPLFLSMSIVGGRNAQRLDGRDVARIMTRRARPYFAHLPPAQRAHITGHSTRVGATQDQFAAGIDGLATQQAGGWASPAMPARYARQLKAADSGSARLARMQEHPA